MMEIVLGAALIASPFVAITALCIHELGAVEALKMWSTVLLMIGTIAGGVILIAHGMNA